MSVTIRRGQRQQQPHRDGHARQTGPTKPAQVQFHVPLPFGAPRALGPSGPARCRPTLARRHPSMIFTSPGYGKATSDNSHRDRPVGTGRSGPSLRGEDRRRFSCFSSICLTDRPGAGRIRGRTGRVPPEWVWCSNALGRNGGAPDRSSGGAFPPSERVTQPARSPQTVPVAFSVMWPCPRGFSRLTCEANPRDFPAGRGVQ